MAQLKLTVTQAQAGRTVLSLLKGELGLSTGCVNRLKRTETGLTLNGHRVFTNARVSAGDLLAAELTAGETPSGLSPIPMALEILFEDEHLLILDKPAPLAVIPSSLVPEEPTLAGGLAHYLGRDFSFHPVNRLDRGTTGVMAVAKTGYIHEKLRRALHSGDFYREYLAICTGCPQPMEGEISLPIGRCPDSAIKRQVDPSGQSARSQYRVLEAGPGFSLVELRPLTGRTHQLRVHMAALGCPLAGDWLYGVEDKALIPRPALHSRRMKLRHPVTGELLELTAPIPADMLRLWEAQHG